MQHPTTATTPELALSVHVPDDHIAKGVLTRDDRGYVLAVIPGDRRLNWRRLNDELGRDLHLATEEEIAGLFMDCDPGAVSPLGRAYGVEMMVDDTFSSLSKVYFESGDHTHLIGVNSESFSQLMRGVRHGHLTTIH